MADRKNCVLVVDDEPLIRLALVMAFEEQGFQVVEAGNVLEAIAVIARGHVDALVTDIDMPGGLSGLDLAELVAAISSAAIVVVSGMPMPPDCILPTGAVFFAKPYNIEHVIAAARAQIAERGNASRATAGLT